MASETCNTPGERGGSSGGLRPYSATAAAGTLREAGNEMLRAGDAAGAAGSYEQALELLGEESPTLRSRVLGNLSAARLAQGELEAALSAARAAAKADELYPKAHYREARALLQLRRPFAAANAARFLLFVLGGPQAPSADDVEGLLAEASQAAADMVSLPATVDPPLTATAAFAGSRPTPSPPSWFDAAPEFPALVARFCDGYDLARLGRCALRFHLEVATREAFLERAASLCPAGSAAWLRTDVSPHVGWLLATRQFVARLGARNRVAVCCHDGHVSLHEPVPGGGTPEAILVPPECLPYSLCWGPLGEYVAYTAVRKGLRRNAALVIAPAAASGLSPVVVPLRAGLTPYYLCPSPCGTRLALLGSLRSRQVLLIADLAQVVTPCREKAQPVALHALGTAAPLYFDWAPHAPELLVAAKGRELSRIRGDVSLECAGPAAALQQRSYEPASDELGPGLGTPHTVLRGAIFFRAPQWLSWPGAPEGRWLLPQNGGGGRRSLSLADPATGLAETVCEHLPLQAQFAAARSGRWVAWCGLHDDRGHGGVFVRRLQPTMGTPIMAFGGTALALTWGGDRLAMLLQVPTADGTSMVWTVWDPQPETNPEGGLATAGGPSTVNGRMSVAPDVFEPSISFAERVLPFFDQYERRHRLWSPGNDAIVLADADGAVLVQPFPPPCAVQGSGAPPESRGHHPLLHLVGAAENAWAAPPAFKVAEGTFACWSPL